jgi:hypothetical protein
MTVPKKLKKVTIDSRFKAALTSKDFNLVQKVDKRGKRVDKQDTTMASFYQLENDSEEGQTPQRGGVEGKYYDEEGKFKWEAQSSSGDDDHEDDEEEAEDDQEPIFDQDD